MVKVAVLLADGFEEIEALTPVDVFRRAGFDVDTLGLFGQEVTGSHDIPVKADAAFAGDLSAYDLIVLPGGMPGSAHLRDDNSLIAALQKEAAAGKKIAAICAAPIVLNRAGLLDSRNYTCFPGVEAEIESGNHQTDVVVVDGNIITSRGAGTALAFSYELVDILGGDGAALANTMVYDRLFK